MSLLAVGLIAPPALALSITETGANGAPTLDGEGATAVAASTDGSNTAIAVGGRGGSPGAASTSGGDAAATAETQASGIGVAWAKATGGVGGDGLVDLTAGPGGDASASAVAENASVQTIQVTAEARGGQGGPLVASSLPGTYGPGGDGGAASLGRVYGASTGGGDVTVEATATGGDGGMAGPEKVAGAGAPVALSDAVDGDTSGSLILRQYAVGGSSGDGQGPLAGSAESHLTRAKSMTSLELVSEATAGGRTGLYVPGTRHGGSGADADASVTGSNDAGSLQVRAAALAGNGALCPVSTCSPTAGGDATASASATTHGDGHAILMGRFPPLPPVNGFPPTQAYGAHGGIGGPSVDGTVAPGQGGDATSQSIGEALGNSSVTVYDFAEGGLGGDFSFSQLGASTPGAPGGNASSTATGIGAGTSTVDVHAYASGGSASVRSLVVSVNTPRGGDAVANASAQGLGEVHAEATAIGGAAWTGGGFSVIPLPSLGGEAHALASAEGASGSVSSLAATSADSVLRMGLTAGASVSSLASVEARASASQPFDSSPMAGVGDVITRGVVMPLGGNVDVVLAGHGALQDAFEQAEVDVFLGLGRFDMRSTQLALSDSILLSSRADFEIAATVINLPGFPGPRSAWIGFFDSDVAGDGFESLRIRLGRNDELILDVLLTDPDAVSPYLDELALDLGLIAPPGYPGGLPTYSGTAHFTVDFDLRVRDLDDAFGVGFIVGSTPIPEPSTALLLALGLAVVAARARRRRGVAI